MKNKEMLIKIVDVGGEYYQVYFDVTGDGDWSYYDTCYSTEEIARRLQWYVEEGDNPLWH